MQSCRVLHNRYRPTLEILGQGDTAIIHLCLDLQTGNYVAVKEVKEMGNWEMDCLVQKQEEILKRFNHENIIRLLDSFKQAQAFFLVLQYCSDGNLTEYVNSRKRLQPVLAVQFLCQIKQAFKLLYKQKCLHRDLKAQNLLVHNGCIKLSDFGVAAMLQSQEDQRQSYFGASKSMAPERKQSKQYGFKSDVYSLGLILYFMLEGKYPKKEDIQKLHIMADNTVIRDFLQRTLAENQFNRFDWQQVFEHQIFSKGHLLQVSLQLEPTLAVQKVQKESNVFKSDLHCKNNPSVNKQGCFQWDNTFNDAAYSYVALKQAIQLQLQVLRQIRRLLGYKLLSSQLVILMKKILMRARHLNRKIFQKQNIFKIDQNIFSKFKEDYSYSRFGILLKNLVAELLNQYESEKKRLIDIFSRMPVGSDLQLIEELQNPQINIKFVNKATFDILKSLQNVANNQQHSIPTRQKCQLMRLVLLRWMEQLIPTRQQFRKQLAPYNNMSIQNLQAHIRKQTQRLYKKS